MFPSTAHEVSGGLTFADLQRQEEYAPWRVYGESKLMNVLFTYELSRRLEGTNVTVNALHPGFVRTNFGRATNGWIGQLLLPVGMVLFAINDRKGAETSVYLASSPEVAGINGKYWSKKKPLSSIDHSYNQDAQKKLWQISESLVQ